MDNPLANYVSLVNTKTKTDNPLAKHVPVENTKTKTDNPLAKHVPGENTMTKSDKLPNLLAKPVPVENTPTRWVKIVVQTVPVDLQQLTGQRRVKHVSRAKPHRLQKMCANSVQLAKKGSPMGYVPVAARANTKTRWVKLLVQIVARANTKTTRVKIIV
jgi:hypothetical protein